MPNGKIRILSLDGGGVRGAATCAFLAELEKAAGKPITEIFDYFAGTSAGGLIALYCGGLGGTAKEASNLFTAGRLGEIMHKTLIARILPIPLLNPRPKYSGEGKRSVLNAVFGAKRLHDAFKPTMVTAYDPADRRIVVLKSHGGDDSAGNPSMAECADCTSAAVTYYPMVKMTESGRWLADGGIAANNPSMVAYSEAKKMGYRDDQIQILSVGTGKQPRPQESPDQFGRTAQNWGVPEWLAHDLIGHCLDGPASAVEYWSRQILGDRFIRADGPITGASPDMDDTRPENIEGLRQMGLNWWKELGPTVLEKLVQFAPKARLEVPREAGMTL